MHYREFLDGPLSLSPWRKVRSHHSNPSAWLPSSLPSFSGSASGRPRSQPLAKSSLLDSATKARQYRSRMVRAPHCRKAQFSHQPAFWGFWPHASSESKWFAIRWSLYQPHTPGSPSLNYGCFFFCGSPWVRPIRSWQKSVLWLDVWCNCCCSGSGLWLSNLAILGPMVWSRASFSQIEIRHLWKSTPWAQFHTLCFFADLPPALSKYLVP